MIFSNKSRWNDIILFAGILLTFSCTNPSSKNRDVNDTTAVIQVVLENRSFLKDHITAKSDTLFFLKPSNYTSAWPSQSTYFKIVYITDTEDAKTINLPEGKRDFRTRIGIPKLAIHADTASIVLYNFGYNVEYQFNLKKENHAWKIIKENAIMY